MRQLLRQHIRGGRLEWSDAPLKFYDERCWSVVHLGADAAVEVASFPASSE